MEADSSSFCEPTRDFRVSYHTKPSLMRALHCGGQRVFNVKRDYRRRQLIKEVRVFGFGFK